MKRLALDRTFENILGKRKLSVALAVLSVAIMIGAAFFAGGLSTAVAKDLGIGARPAAATANASPTPWTYPTTTMQEPGYTNGTYNWAATASVEHLNVYLATDAYSFALLDEIYDSLTQLSPNATPTVMPWLAASIPTEGNMTAMNMTTFDPVTGQVMPVKYVWNVTLRPGVQWTDWTPANASQTYVFSNYTSFNAFNYSTGTVQSYSHTYKWPSVTMQKYYVQSADVILTWKMLQSSLDFSGSYANVVNVIPLSNLTVQFQLSSQSASFMFYTLETIVMPYHIWVNHDWATSIQTAWNYTGAPNGYDTWNLNYNPSTGTASGLVGSGPFMFNGGYGMPQGQWIPDSYWKEYVNPHYFVQYGPSWMHQYTPKFFELYTPQYLSVSAAATAELLGQVYTIQFGLPPTFLPTIKTMPSTYIYHKPSTGYGYIQLNSYPTNAPYNITSFRQALNYATDKAYLASVIAEGYDILGQPVIPVSDSIWHNYSTPQYSYNPALAWNMINNTTGFFWHPTTAGTTYPMPGQWYYGATKATAKPVTADMQITVASEDPLGVEGALIIAKEWAAIGVPTTVTQEAFTTLVSNLITYSYSSINLGITGIDGDPTGDFFAFYNSTIGLGKGFYLGPFSSLNVNGKMLNGTQVDSLMNNLTNQLNTVTNFSKRLAIAYEIEGIAAEESTMINLGYPIDILPITNSTFTGIIKDALPYLGFMYWNFLSLHQRTAVVTVTPPKTVPIQLHVGVVTPGTVYFNGQMATATVQVRNQYGQPVSGASVDIGYSPQGALVNISSYKLVTNSAGQALWTFKVLGNNPLVYTSDYSGEINISAAAFMPANYTGTVVPGLGYTHIDVSPQPVAYKTTSMPVLIAGKNWTYYNITVYNPANGSPVSGYQYTVQTLNGAVSLLNTSDKQVISNTTSFNPIYGFGFQSVSILNSSVPDYNLTSVTGVTDSNGNISILVKASPLANFSAMGSTFLSYIFLGDYAAGGALGGAAPWDVIAQMTSATNNNPIFGPEGFGVQQPVELPVEVANSSASANVKIELSVAAPNSTISPFGQTNVTVTVVNSTGAPVPNYTVILSSQNALGANRGFFINTSGVQMQGYNPNIFFGSTFLPSISLVTNATGVAMASFTPQLYQSVYSPSGVFVGFSAQSYTDNYLIPFDEFQLTAMSMSGEAASGTVYSTQYENNATPMPVLAAYVQGESSVNGVTILPANSSYTMFVNSTENTPAGPSTPGISFNVSVTLGNVSVSSGTTASNGSFAITYNAPNVSVLTPVTIKIQSASGTTTQTIYLVPHYTVTTTILKTTTKTTTVSTVPAYAYGLIGLFVVLTVVFAVLYATSRRSKGGNKGGPNSGSP
jgi:ABC-type transport system substrate-binding protein